MEMVSGTGVDEREVAEQPKEIGQIYELRILQYPAHEKLLRRKARNVTEEEFGTPQLFEFASSLGYAMMSAHGIGLASTQVEPTFTADGTPWRLFTMAVGERYVVLCNPEVTREGEDRVENEGCLSFASVLEPMRAPGMVRVKYRTTRGVEREMALEGTMARCVWHENDHLDGAVLLDRMSAMKRAMFMKRVAKVRGRIS